MSQVIWQFTVDASDGIAISKGARILSVGAQGPNVVIWAAVHPDAPQVWRKIKVLPTGGQLPPTTVKAEFIGTVQADNGLVWHVFDGGESR